MKKKPGQISGLAFPVANFEIRSDHGFT